MFPNCLLYTPEDPRAALILQDQRDFLRVHQGCQKMRPIYPTPPQCKTHTIDVPSPNALTEVHIPSRGKSTLSYYQMDSKTMLATVIGSD
ncbi:hypothetical protein STEG23_023380 [Scotinomys teguina]